MIFVAVAAFAVLLILVAVSREQAQAFERERSLWASERRELLERIQRPEFVPRGVTEAYTTPERDAEELQAVANWNKVGTITIDPDYEGE